MSEAESKAPGTTVGRRAVLLVRNGVSQDARVLRAADVLRGEGFSVTVVGSITTSTPLPHERLGAIDVVRLRARSPIGLASRLTGGRLPAGAAAAHRSLTALDWNRRALGQLWRLRPQLIHANDYNTMWPALAARRLLGARVIYDSHELWADRNGRREWRRWLVAAESRFVRAADAVITPSPGYAEVLAARYGIDPPAVVRNIPRTKRRPGQRGLEPHAPAVIVYAGGLMPGRGLEVAIRALPAVPKAHLRLVGGGTEAYVARLRAVAGAAGVGDRVEFVGTVPADDLVDALEPATAGLALIEPICLSYELTLPNKLFEYAAAGLPVVGSDVPLIASVVREWDIGEIADPSDTRSVAAACRRVVEPARHHECVRKLVRFTKQNTWSFEARVLAQIYRDVSGRGR